MRSLVRLGALATAASLTSPGLVHADFVGRHLTVGGNGIAVGTGLGIARTSIDSAAFGLSVELRAGLVEELEVAVRSGLRFGEAGRQTGADYYGRTFDPETYGLEDRTVVNPELALRWGFRPGLLGQLGVEARLYLPVQGAPSGFMVGLPFLFRLRPFRLDTGLFVPVIFTKPDTSHLLSFPVRLWFQAGPVALGLVTGVRLFKGGFSDTSRGGALNVGVTEMIDIQAWFLFPNVDLGPKVYGGGLAVEVRFRRGESPPR